MVTRWRCVPKDAGRNNPRTALCTHTYKVTPIQQEESHSHQMRTTTRISLSSSASIPLTDMIDALQFHNHPLQTGDLLVSTVETRAAQNDVARYHGHGHRRERQHGRCSCSVSRGHGRALAFYGVTTEGHRRALAFYGVSSVTIETNAGGYNDYVGCPDKCAATGNATPATLSCSPTSAGTRKLYTVALLSRHRY